VCGVASDTNTTALPSSRLVCEKYTEEKRSFHDGSLAVVEVNDNVAIYSSTRLYVQASREDVDVEEVHMDQASNYGIRDEQWQLAAPTELVHEIAKFALAVDLVHFPCTDQKLV
jgi:hypothetical protein